MVEPYGNNNSYPPILAAGGEWPVFIHQVHGQYLLHDHARPHFVLSHWSPLL